MNLFFRCWHRKTTLPLRRRDAASSGVDDMYVVCLECGRHLIYDSARGRIGRALPCDE